MSGRVVARTVRLVGYAALAGAIVGLVIGVATYARAGDVYEGTNGPDVFHMNEHHSSQATTIYGLAGDDRIWGGRGSDTIHGGPGDDRIHNFHAASGALYGGAGWDVCVVGVKPGGSTNVSWTGCEVVRYRASQGHG